VEAVAQHIPEEIGECAKAACPSLVPCRCAASRCSASTVGHSYLFVPIVTSSVLSLYARPRQTVEDLSSFRGCDSAPRVESSNSALCICYLYRAGLAVVPYLTSTRYSRRRAATGGL
jgi:hypothetical protein